MASRVLNMVRIMFWTPKNNFIFTITLYFELLNFISEKKKTHKFKAHFFSRERIFCEFLRIFPGALEPGFDDRVVAHVEAGGGSPGRMVGSGGGSHFVAATAALLRQECLKKKVVKTPRLLPTRLKSRKPRQSHGYLPP